MISRVWQLVLLALSVLVAGGTVQAQPAAPTLPMTQFVDDTTVLVADINIAALDLEAARGWASALLKQGGLPEARLTDFERGSEKGLGTLKDWQGDFVKAGGSHMYLVISANHKSPVLIVFPIGAVGSADALKQTLTKQGALPPDIMRDSSTEVIGNMLVMSNAAGVKQAKEVAGNPQRIPRPDLASAFAAAGNAPYRLAFAPSEQVKGGQIIQQPMLPQELGGGTTAPIANAFRFAYISLQSPTAASPKANARIVIQARDADGAQTLKSVADTWIKLLRGQADHVGFPDQLTPQIAGDQLVVEIDQAKFESLAKTLVDAIAGVRDQAKKNQSVSNMRQIFMASMRYANENKSNLPTRVPDDIAVYLSTPDKPDLQKTFFTNPVNGRYPGYVYVKPAEKMTQIKNPTRCVLLYEAYDQWLAGGINVGFADGHVELVANEADFKKMLDNK